MAPLFYFLRIFASDSSPHHRVDVSESDIFIKGVIEILSSKVKLRKFDIQHEDEIGNGTCIGCLYPVAIGSLYCKIGVGLLFYPC